eukprot:m.257607 g.257607  ORF g.257607 m.257607 type:complete len:459 (+) comp35466_c0_seq1:102-1478(+)
MEFSYPSFEGLRRFPSSTFDHMTDAAAPVNAETPQQSLPRKHAIRTTKAIITIGGPKDGTRFRPLSFNCPKPLFPIAGVPMIYHQMEACAKIPGISEIVLIGVFPESEITSFAAVASQNLGLPVRYLREFKPLGTGGGLYFFRDLLTRDKPDCLLVLHSDICADFRLEDALNFHAAKGEGDHVTIFGTTARKEHSTNYGCIITDENTMEVLHYVEKPKSFVSQDINAGVYILSPSVFEDMKEVFLANHDSDSQTEEIWLEKDILTKLAGTGRLFMFKSGAFWSQIKTASSAIYANRHYLEVYRKSHPECLTRVTKDGPVIVGDVRIHPSADVHPSAKLGPNVSVGPGVRIGAGARIKDSIIMKSVVIGSHSVIMNSIVDSGARIGDWTRIEGAKCGANPNDPTTSVPESPLFSADGKLQPNVTIVGEETIVADGVLVLNVICMPHKELTSDSHNEIIL